jgi:Cu-processing system permease protein
MSEPPAVAPQRSYMHHIKEDAWGVFVITKREFIANIKSFRSIVMVFILALIMVGAAMGFAALTTSEDANEEMHFMVVAMDPDGQANDLVVFLYETRSFEPVEGKAIFLAEEVEEIPEYSGRSDPNGHWVAVNLTAGYHLLIFEIQDDSGGNGPFGESSSFSSTYIYVPHNNTVPYPQLGVDSWQSDIRDVGGLKDVAVHVVDLEGRPVKGAEVAVGDLTNTTNAQGVATFLKVRKGEYIITATSGTLGGMDVVNVTHTEIETDPFAFALGGPDDVLRLVAAIAIGLIGPIYAIVLCFDSVFRERISGSIDYLLCRPMGRRAVLLGKFTGILSALMVPIIAVALLGVGVISWRSGTSPNGELVLGFLIYTVFLVSIFVTLQMIFSTVAKTTGTAILSGIGVWIFFFMLFDLILFLVSYLMDLSGDAQQIFFNRASFLNPISIYSLAIGQLGTDESIAGVPDWAPGVALVIVAVVLLIAAMEIFTRRVTE